MDKREYYFIRKKMLFISITLMIALLFYFLLPLSLIFIPEVMNRPSFFLEIPWTWLYAFSQLPMTWIFGWIYHLFAHSMERKMGEENK